MSVTLTPGAQDHGWRLRWRTIRECLPTVVGPQGGPVSAVSIEQAERRLFEFMASCYHLKDVLIAEGVLPKAEVESKISSTAVLALLADLANLDKHHVLNRPPRSGDVPVYRERSAFGDGTGWRLRVTFDHKGSTIVAGEVAREAVEAWELFLRDRGVL